MRSPTFIAAILASAGFAAANCGSGISATRKAKAVKAFKDNTIIPGVVAPKWNPTLDVKPSYGKKAVDFGNLFSTVESAMAPTVNIGPESAHDPAQTNYTSILVDPDATGPATPILRFFLHRIQYNLQPTCVGDSPNKKTQTFYAPLTPASVASHRYIFLVYRQPEGDFTPPTQLATVARTPFDVKKFVADSGLVLVGGNFMNEGLGSIGDVGK